MRVSAGVARNLAAASGRNLEDSLAYIRASQPLNPEIKIDLRGGRELRVVYSNGHVHHYEVNKLQLQLPG